MAKKRRPPTAGTRRGNGAGWGGAAKGVSSTRRHDFLGEPGPGRGHFSEKGEARAERRARHAEEMHQILYEFAHDATKGDLIRLSAANHLLNRIEGLPTAKVISTEVDAYAQMSEEELDAEIEAQRSRVAAYEALRKRGSLT